MSDDFDYNPEGLLDEIKARFHLKNDAALSKALRISPPAISKIRQKKLPVGTSLLVRLHEISNLPIKDLRELMGDRRPNFGPIQL